MKNDELNELIQLAYSRSGIRSGLAKAWVHYRTMSIAYRVIDIFVFLMFVGWVLLLIYAMGGHVWLWVFGTLFIVGHFLHRAFAHGVSVALEDVAKEVVKESDK